MHDITYHLTSPHMRGPGVTAAQKLLKNNVFKTDFLKGNVDGDFGEETQRACLRAHYWVGDSTSQPVIGHRLEDFLSDKVKLPADNAARRNIRLKKLQETPLRVHAFDLLKGKLGTKESPAGSNHCWATEWYGLTGPWCAMSVSWAYTSIGSKAFGKASTGHYAYVPYLVNDAKAGRNGLSVVSAEHVQIGDPVAYDWEGNGVADHVGLFEKWIVKGHTFSAIEGNTSLGNNSNGGEVMRRERTVNQVAAFIHVSK